MIKLTGINKIYRTNEIETVALENVNLEVNKGEFLSIMGPSGCGKSTLLNIMGLLDGVLGGFYGYYITMLHRISVHKVEKSFLTFLSNSTVLNS